MKRFIPFLLVLLSVSVVSAQSNVEVRGSGKTGMIAYGETMTGELEVSDASDLTPIRFVGHNGKDRVQGDFDVWYFDTQKGDNVIIRMDATDGDFVPILLITYEDKTTITHMTGPVDRDDNVDGDSEAGVCLRNVPQSNQYAIVAYRTEAVQGKYSLSLEKVDSVDALAGGSKTLWCTVGTFVYTRGDSLVNIRADAGRQYSIKARMQPGQPYNFFSFGEKWTQIGYADENGLTTGFVSTPLIRITGTLGDADETPEPSG